jgi:CRP-like cAMP-binding protein
MYKELKEYKDYSTSPRMKKMPAYKTFEEINNTNQSVKTLESILALYREKPVFDMTGSELRSIYQFLSTLDYFRSITNLLTSQDCWKIVNSIKFIEKKSGEAVYTFGDKSKLFYIVLRGSVSVKMPKAQAKSNELVRFKETLQYYEVNKVVEGCGFGEYSIYYKTDREATVECIEDCVLAYFSQDEYNEIFYQFEKERIAITVSFLKKCAFFKEFSSLEMEKLHFFLSKKLYFSGQCVFKEDNLTDGLYIIKSGNFELFKMWNLDEYAEVEKLSKIDLADHSVHDVFGEIETLTQLKKRQYSVLCSKGGEVIFIHKVVFFNIATPYSLKRKNELNDKKIEIMNNVFKMRAINLSKMVNEESNKIHMKTNFYINPLIVKKTELDVNYHGFADNARRKGKAFNKSLDKFLTNISFINYEKIQKSDLPMLHFTSPQIKPSITLASTARGQFFMRQDNKGKSRTSLLLPGGVHTTFKTTTCNYITLS